MNTTCPEPGRLRAWLDQETGPVHEDAMMDHLAVCDACQSALGSLSRDAELVGRALAEMAGPAPSAAETALALAQVRGRLGDRVTVVGAVNGCAMTPDAIASDRDVSDDTPAPARSLDTTPLTPALSQRERAHASAPGRLPMPISLVWQRWRLALGGLAAALALTFALATPEGQAAAASFLAQFRSQRLAIVTIDPNQARQTGLFRLERLGTVTNGQPSRPVEAANLKEAADKTGMQTILQPDPATLPAGASKTPKIRYSPASETRLTFDKQKVRAYFDSIGRKDLALPDKLNGVTLVVSLPPVVMLEYGTTDANRPAVMVGQAREVQVGVEGNASLEEVRAFLLGLPDLPPDLVRQLRSIQDWTTTLPIPVPVDKMTWQETKIGGTQGGAQGYILNDNTGLGSGTIWQKDGRILGVAGPMKATDLRKIAESLR